MQASTFPSIGQTALRQLGELLASLPSGRAMNVPTLDGFFAALAAGPDVVPESEYLPVVCGIADAEDLQALERFDGVESLVALLAQLMEGIRAALEAGLREHSVYLPNVDADANGRALGNDWANGFLRGLRLRGKSWSALRNDPREVHLMVPIFTLAHDHNADAQLRAAPISDAERGDLIRRATAYLTLIHRYFEPLRANANAARERGRVGRNDPCPCGSGKKYKQCCGNPQHLH